MAPLILVPVFGAPAVFATLKRVSGEGSQGRLPEWLATLLKEQLGDGFWPLGDVLVGVSEVEGAEEGRQVLPFDKTVSRSACGATPWATPRYPCSPLSALDSLPC